MTRFARLSLAAVPFLALATPSQAAVTLTSTLGSAAGFAAPASDLAISFDTELPDGVTLLLDRAGILSGNSADGATPGYSDGSAYLSVRKDGVASLLTDTGYSSVSFFIGSIDSYNSVELIGTTGALLASYTGSEFTTTANGNMEQANTNRRVTVTVDPNDPLIGGIRFKSGGNSLEVDHIVFSVPEPSVWMLMLLGFSMVAGATRYRRRSTQLVFG